ncbi:MAG: aldose epimerase family protein, partial [Deinococcota bacterium]
THLFVAGKDGQRDDVVWGFDKLEDYHQHNHSIYFGATIGRVANRMGGAQFTLDDTTYQLSQNDGANHLHGGEVGFNRVVWQAHTQETAGGPEVTLQHVSEAGDQGYPGQLEVSLRYSLNHDGHLRLDYHALTDEPTPVNLTHHSYFNLAGSGTIDAHTMQVFADHVLDVDVGLIPTGRLLDITGSALDLRTPSVLGKHLHHKDVAAVGGIDHCYVLAGDGLKRAALVWHEASGRRLEVVTDQPAIQVYTGNFLDGITGKQGRTYNQHSALCLETQHYPDSPNHLYFPSIILQPGARYSHTTIYKFSTQ